MMRLLVDQDVYYVTIEWLRKEGHDGVTAKELGMQRAADEDLLKKAKVTDRLFLTRDKGFGALVFFENGAISGCHSTARHTGGNGGSLSGD